MNDLGGDRARKLGQEGEKKGMVARARASQTEVEGGVVCCFPKDVRDPHI